MSGSPPTPAYAETAGPAEDEGRHTDPPGPGSAAPEDGGPSPAETDALAWAEIAEASQRKRCAGARALNGFLRDGIHAQATPKGDARTNIIDQGARATYALGRDHLRALLRHLEACRLEGSIAHFSERQGTPAAPRSGLMLDFDVITTARKPVLGPRHYYRLAGALIAALQRDIDIGGQLPPLPGGRKPAEAKIHVFFTVKPEAVPVSLSPAAAAAAQASGAFDIRAPAQAGGAGGADGAGAPQTYKYGLHILVPGLRLGRAYKKWLLRGFREDPAVLATLAELGATGDAAACLDQNSASVPVLFFGSCKRGGTPYVLGAALEVTVDLGFDGGAGGGWTPPPVVKTLSDAELAGYNLAAELSLTADAEYEDGRAPLVTAFEFEPRPAVAEKARDWGERTHGDATPGQELLLAEHSLSLLTLQDAEARHLHALLDLLPDEFLADRNRWRDVVFALANTSAAYKPLAVWFSQKCRHRSRPGSRADELDSLWDDAVARRGRVGDPVTVNSIKQWARAANPQRYAEVTERSFFAMLLVFVYAHGGRLQHYMVSKVIHAMLAGLFVVDVDVGPRGGASYCWYAFVLPGAAMRPGEVWKWRKETEPDDVHVYMSEKLARVFDQVDEHIEERRAAAVDEEQAKYYKNLGAKFATSKLSLHNDGFKNGVVRQANYLFRRRGFADSLDRAPDLLGVLNGVLRVGPRCVLIDHFHEHPVSKFTPVAWRPFDPADPWVRLALDAIADIIVEPDARDWILFHAAQGLSGEPKEGLFLLWEGGGQNGKTSFLRWVAKALGPYAAKFNIQLLCCEREDADRPNSAVMRFEHLNYAYAEESNKAQHLNVARMKEMVNAGEVSGRDLNSKQKEFTMRANFVSASQYPILIDTTDHGTWRRVKRYGSKAAFRKNPDPNNPREKKDDQRFVRQYPTDPNFQSAILSILSHYYERLANEYGGELKNVRSPTIERETADFRLSQDALHRWICETIVVSPEHEAEYALGVLGGYYTEWYTAHIDRKRHVAGEVIKDIEASVLSKYLKPAPNRTMVLRGCRVLTPDDTKLHPGEEYINDAEMRGGRSAREWADACAEVDDAAWSSHGVASTELRSRADGLPWWAARSPRPGAAAAAAAAAAPAAKPVESPSLAADLSAPFGGAGAPDTPPRANNVADPAEPADLDGLFDLADDLAVTRAGGPAPAPRAAQRAVTDAEVEALLDGRVAARPGGFTLDDVYAQ